MDKRYQRQIQLKEFGPKAQARLASSKVLVVGAGGLGVPVLTYLNAMGVGTLGIVDRDTVSLTNLHRQVLYNEGDIGKSKALVARDRLQDQNSGTDIRVHETYLTVENALAILSEYDLVVDATDNFPTRYLINDACVLLKKPFVYGALYSFEGQVSVFNYQGGPTYRCLFPNMPGPDEVPDCNTNGVLGILPGIIGNFQAMEAVKIVTGLPHVLSGKLLLYDALGQQLQKVSLSLKPENLNIGNLQVSYGYECATGALSVSPDVFMERLSKGIQLIDVRTMKEYSNCNLPGAKNIPLDELQHRASEIREELPVYLLCQSGMRSAKAQRLLASMWPHAQLINVEGGMAALEAHIDL